MLIVLNLQDNTKEKRRKYETFLEKVPLLGEGLYNVCYNMEKGPLLGEGLYNVVCHNMERSIIIIQVSRIKDLQ